VRIRSYTLPSTLAFVAAGGIAACANGTGGGGGSFSETSSGTESQSSSASDTTGNSTTTSTNGGSSTNGSSTAGSSTAASSTASTAGSCAFTDGAAPTGNFKFPQARKYAGCTYPTTTSVAQVCNAYNAWYSGITTTAGAGSNRRVFDKSFDSGNTTSEGMAYGMLIAVYMSDKPAFDAFWGYASSHFSNGLMSWHIDPNGGTIDPHSATDADEDMAWALLMADKQWGGGTYLSAATGMLGHIKAEFSGNLPTDGDFGASFTHPDYAAPDYNATFAAASNDTSWNSVSSAEYSAFTQHWNSSTGLIPDSITTSSDFGFDACRAPWRAGVDFCWHGSSSASAFLTPQVATFKSLAAAATPFPGNLKLHLSLAGQPVSGATVTGAIVGPAAVAAMMSSSNQAFIDSSWTFLATYVKNASMSGIYGSSGDYFGDTLGMIGLLVMSGNFSDFTHP
jgi:Glycosyl hydrolases family 8